MKKRVLLYLVMIVSLAAIAYSAAITNPGHGVEEIGSGSSPYAPFRDWNVVELGYEDQYSGPSALKGNVFWLGTINAETIAAQNIFGDWCAIQIHPSGIYMNCYNNASNMTLYNSYYWNGTHYIKNDTIKEGPVVKEQKILGAGQNGGKEETTITGSGGNTAGSSIQSDGVVTESTMEVKKPATSGGASFTAVMDGAGGKATTTGTDGVKTGIVEVEPDKVKASADDGAGTGGDLTIGTAGTSVDFNFLGITVSSSEQGSDANGGTFITTTDNIGGTAKNIFTMGFIPAGDGVSTWSVENNAGTTTASVELNAMGGSITLSGASTTDEDGNSFIVVTGTMALFDPGGGVSAPVFWGTDFCTPTSIHSLSDPACYLSRFDLGITVPGSLYVEFLLSPIGAPCSGIVEFVCYKFT